MHRVWVGGGRVAIRDSRIALPSGSEHHRPEEFFARDKFLASIRDRLGTAAVKEQALDLCLEFFVADGARSDEEEAVFQNLRKLLE